MVAGGTEARGQAECQSRFPLCELWLTYGRRWLAQASVSASTRAPTEWCPTWRTGGIDIRLVTFHDYVHDDAMLLARQVLSLTIHDPLWPAGIDPPSLRTCSQSGSGRGTATAAGAGTAPPPARRRTALQAMAR